MKILLATVASLVVPAISFSQEAASPEEPRRAIEEIVVTAQRKEQKLQDVPISITALQGEFLREAGIDDLHELVEFTPNVRFTSHITVFMRGMGSPFSVGSFDPAVSLALDELSIPRDIYMADPLYDIERFEVLRGPQGTLFGKNTPAGLFNVVTGNPTDELSGHLVGRIGGLGAHRVEAAIGGPLGPYGNVAQFRIAVVELEDKGDIENTMLGITQPSPEQQAGRLKLAVQPIDGLDVLLIGSRAQSEVNFFHIQQHEMRESSVTFLRRFDPEFEDDGTNHQGSQNLANRLKRETDILQANVRYDLGTIGPIRDSEIVAVVGTTGYDQENPLDAESTPADLVNIVLPAIFNYDQRSAEIRGSGVFDAPFGLGEIEFLGGFLLFDSDLLANSPIEAGEDFDEYLLSPAAFELVTGSPPPGEMGFADLATATAALGVNPVTDPSALEGDGVRFILDQTGRSDAVFGQTSWHFTPAWTLSLGARVTFETKEAHVVGDCFDPGVICGALGAEEYDVNIDQDETDVSPKVTLQYRPWEELTLFAARGEGYKSGGFNNFSFTADGVQVGPESSESWEVGAKGDALDGALSYGATFYNMDIEDLQLQNLVGTVVQVRNAASARTRGLELDFQWLTPSEQLSFNRSGAYNDAKYKSNPNAPA
ncbi:MAG: TonB-dependent receptor, partial [Candidatus Binatia bacterium]